MARWVAADLRAVLAGPKQSRRWRFDSVAQIEIGKIHKQELHAASCSGGRMFDLRSLENEKAVEIN